MNGERVGTWRTAGGRDELRYAESWLQSPSARPISLKFPLRPGSTPYTGPYVHRYFDNLLPLPTWKSITAAEKSLFWLQRLVIVP